MQVRPPPQHQAADGFSGDSSNPGFGLAEGVNQAPICQPAEASSCQPRIGQCDCRLTSFQVAALNAALATRLFCWFFASVATSRASRIRNGSARKRSAGYPQTRPSN